MQLWNSCRIRKEKQELKRKAVLGITLTLLFIGILSLTFDIQPVEAPYPIIYIKADGSIDPSTANITSPDNVTYTFTADINASIVVQKNNTVIDGAGYTLQGTGSETGIDLHSINNVTLQNIEVTNFNIGIHLSGSSNTLAGNTASNNTYGIDLSSSSNNVLSGNNASNNQYGILLDTSSNNNIVSGNTASSNNDYGISLYNSSSNNTVIGNTASNNDYGIYLYSSSNNNTVTGNNASNNQYGIYLEVSSNNVLFHNDFIDNTNQAFVTAGYTNIWDDGFEGNYWSNYTGVDLDHDGIGDTEHVIDADNKDNYPLMGMFSDFKATSEYHVQTICNSSISDFQYNGTAICFNVTGETDTTGFCRICIPRALMNETYQVFVNCTEVQCNLLPCSNTTHSYLYFTYNHSTQEVMIVPEFPTWTSMLLILIVLTVAIAIYKRRLLKTSIN
jgi:parallel beta-helix repeat protein